MWSGTPEVPLAIIFGTFTAMLIYFMFSLLIYAFERL